jgi:membrane-bound lytic murein transglycosylase D
MKNQLRVLGVSLLFFVAGCRSSAPVDSINDMDDVTIDPSAAAADGKTSESPDEDDVSEEFAGDGYCHDGIVARHLIESYRRANPISAAERKTISKRRRFAGTIDTKALAHARDTLSGPAAPYFGAIPVVVNSEVDFWIQYYKTSGRRQFMRWLVRGESFKEVLQPILQENGLPPEFFYLAMIESGFNNSAYSRAKATGTWQFMKGTAKLYGLRIDHWVDERRDPVKSSVAAASYLRDLYRELGDWHLAMAAYNAGPGKIRRAIRATGSRDFWEIARTRHLAKETKQYVPKMLAAVLLASNPRSHGFDYQQSPDEDFPISTVKINRPVRLDEVAAELNIGLALLQKWNPEIIRNITPPRKDGYELRLSEPLTDMYGLIAENLSLVEVTDVQMHKIRRGDTLSHIARLYKVSIKQIMQFNPGLRSVALRPGREIAIPIPGIVTTTTKNGAKTVL